MTRLIRSVRAVATTCAFAAMWAANVALAQTPPGMSPMPALPPGVVPPQDPAQRLLDEQRSRELQRELDRQPAPIEVTPSAASQVPDLPADTDVETLPDPEPTFRIDHIVYKGGAVLSQSQRDRISAPFLHKSLGRRRIDLLLRRLTEAFVANGLITTRAYLATPQNLSSGTLAITIVAGRIGGFTLNGGALRPSGNGPKGDGGGLLTDAGTAWAFPASVDDVLVLPALEQGVDQINRLRRNQAQIQILPGQAAGESIVAIQNPFGSGLNYNVGMDNYGSTATGKWRTRASVEAGNVIGLQESLNLSYIGTRDSNAFVLSAAIPYGYHTFSYTAALSEYQQIIGGTALLYGRTLSQIFGWNNVLTRSSTGRISMDATLTRLTTERDVNDIPLTPQDLTILRVGVSGLWRFTRGGQPGHSPHRSASRRDCRGSMLRATSTAYRSRTPTPNSPRSMPVPRCRCCLRTLARRTGHGAAPSPASTAPWRFSATRRYSSAERTRCAASRRVASRATAASTCATRPSGPTRRCGRACAGSLTSFSMAARRIWLPKPVGPR